MFQGFQDSIQAKLDEAKAAVVGQYDTAVAGKRLLDEGGAAAWASIDAKADCVRAEAFHASLLADFDGLGANYAELSGMLREAAQTSAASSLLGDPDLSDVDAIRGFGPLAEVCSQRAHSFAFASVSLGVPAPTKQVCSNTPSEDVAAKIVWTWRQHHDNVAKPTAEAWNDKVAQPWQQSVDSTRASIQCGVDSTKDAFRLWNPDGTPNIAHRPVGPQISRDSHGAPSSQRGKGSGKSAATTTDIDSFQGPPPPRGDDGDVDGCDLDESIHADPVQSKIERIVKLQAAKKEAVESEDFDRAKKLKSEIEDMQNQATEEAAAKTKAEEEAAEKLAAEIAQLEAKKADAIEVEDFDLAKTLKSELLDLQNQATEAAAAKAKAEEDAEEQAAQDALEAEIAEIEKAALETAAQEAQEAAIEKAAQDSLAAEKKKAEEAALEKAAQDAFDAELADMDVQKAEAIANEDFDEAKRLKLQIQDLKKQAIEEADAQKKVDEEEALQKAARDATAAEITELEAQKAEAIKVEDFDSAKRLKTEIEGRQNIAIHIEEAFAKRKAEEKGAQDVVAAERAPSEDASHKASRETTAESPAKTEPDQAKTPDAKKDDVPVQTPDSEKAQVEKTPEKQGDKTPEAIDSEEKQGQKAEDGSQNVSAQVGKPTATGALPAETDTSEEPSVVHL